MPHRSADPPRCRRVAIYLFYDDGGRVDRYVTVALAAFRAEVDRLIVVCNGEPEAEGLAALRASADDVIVRENAGFDVWGYKEAIERIGRDGARAYDELILLNYTFFAPIFPLREMFDSMDARACDFWGITAHAEMRPNPLTGGDVLRAFPRRDLPFELVNNYGPSECAIVATSGVVPWRGKSDDDGQLPSIGRPISGAIIHILDETRQPLARGEEGVPPRLELGVAGGPAARVAADRGACRVGHRITLADGSRRTRRAGAPC